MLAALTGLLHCRACCSTSAAAFLCLAWAVATAACITATHRPIPPPPAIVLQPWARAVPPPTKRCSGQTPRGATFAHAPSGGPAPLLCAKRGSSWRRHQSTMLQCVAARSASSWHARCSCKVRVYSLSCLGKLQGGRGVASAAGLSGCVSREPACCSSCRRSWLQDCGWLLCSMLCSTACAAVCRSWRAGGCCDPPSLPCLLLWLV